MGVGDPAEEPASGRLIRAGWDAACTAAPPGASLEGECAEYVRIVEERKIYLALDILRYVLCRACKKE